MSSLQISGLRRIYSPNIERALVRIEIDNFYSERAQPLYSALEVAALPDDHRPETKLPHQSAAIPAGRQSRDHDELCDNSAAGLPYGMHPSRRAVKDLRSVRAVVAGSQEFAALVKDRRADWNAASASPLRASAMATSSIAE